MKKHIKKLILVLFVAAIAVCIGCFIYFHTEPAATSLCILDYIEVSY